MVLENDWVRATQDLITRERERIGDPPTPEEILAYSRGELTEAEEERIREAISYYPDVAKALSEADHDDYEPTLSNLELAADWTRLEQRLPPTGLRRTSDPAPPPVSRTWKLATAASLALAAVLGALYLRSASAVRILQTELRQPREHVERVVLLEHTPRGGDAPAQAPKLQPSTEYVVLTLTLLDEVPDGPFTVEIRDTNATPPSVVWKSPITRGLDGTFSLEVPRSFLTAREYEINLYVTGRIEPVAVYAFELGSG
jgi:Asp-tRNA(Asn)/Glu-tRNA(Gln) amidotransferase C subunit